MIITHTSALTQQRHSTPTHQTSNTINIVRFMQTLNNCILRILVPHILVLRILVLRILVPRIHSYTTHSYTTHSFVHYAIVYYAFVYHIRTLHTSITYLYTTVRTYWASVFIESILTQTPDTYFYNWWPRGHDAARSHPGGEDQLWSQKAPIRDCCCCEIQKWICRRQKSRWSLTHLLTCLLTYLLTYSLTYSLTCLLTHSLTCLLTHSLPYSLTHSLTHSPTHSLTHPRDMAVAVSVS